MNILSKQISDEINNQEENTRKYLTFYLGDKTYAISVLKIREIIEYNSITPIPKMPKFIRGAINLRGQIVPVIDLMERLDIGENTISNRTCIVIVSVKHGLSPIIAGLMVDSVSKVLDFETTDIEEAPDFGGTIDTHFLEGMGKNNDNFTVILDIDYILSMEDLKVLQELAESEELDLGESESNSNNDDQLEEKVDFDESEEIILSDEEQENVQDSDGDDTLDVDSA